MADKDYLKEWRDLYSYPNYITDNQYLTEDGKASLDNENDWDISQEKLILGSAVGTAANFYLDPNPLFNKVGDIYSSVITQVFGNTSIDSFTSARTDAIKMNLRNMDYTNGKNSIGIESQPPLEFFRFYEDTETAEQIFKKENALRLSADLAKINNISEKDAEGNKIISYRYSDFREKVEFWGTEWAKNLDELVKYIKENNLLSSITDSDSNESYTVLIIDNVYIQDEENNLIHYIIPNVRMAALLSRIVSKISGEQTGLQLLMPQYHRRVEVEDLNKNFWVISLLLDASLNALWGPYGIIDVVRQLIFRINQLNDKNKVQDIELLHNGSDDLYFDMYSRFILPSLELKLKTESGERIIKNIFKGHDNKHDRATSSYSGEKVSDLFNNITMEMFGQQDYSKNELVLWPTEEDKNFTGLFDSDLICSEGTVSFEDGSRYVSLSSVIDEINGKLVLSDEIFTGYDYSRDEADQKFFEIFDNSIGDKNFSVKDYDILKKDIETNFSDVVLTKTELERFKKYEQSYQFLLNLKNKNEDENEDENNMPKIFNSADIEEFYTEQFVFVKPDENSNEDSGFSLEIYQSELDKIYKHLEQYTQNNKQNSIINSPIVYDNYYPETFEVLHEQYRKILSVCETSEPSETNEKSEWTIFAVPPQLIEYRMLEKSDLNNPFSDAGNAFLYHSNADSFWSNEDAIEYSDNDIKTSILDCLNKKTLPITFELSDDFELSKINDKFIDLEDYLKVTLEENSDPLSLKDFNDQIRQTFFNVYEEELKSTVKTIKIIDEDDKVKYFLRIPLCYSTSIAARISLTLNREEAVYTTTTPGQIFIYNTNADITDPDVINNIINIDNNINKNDKIITFKTIQYEKYNFKKLKVEKPLIIKGNVTPIYSYKVAQGIASVLADKDKKIDLDEYVNFLNVNKDGEVSIRDSAAISAYAKNPPVDYINFVREKEEILDNQKEGYNELITALGKIGISTDQSVEEIKSQIFNYIENPLRNFSFLTSFHIPTQKFLNALKEMDNTSKSNIEWSFEDKGILLDSVEDCEYSLCNNILVYLFDEDYYTLKKEDNKFKLYVKATDIYFSKINNPLISTEAITDSQKTVFLFVPRADLREGEIIELRLTGKGSLAYYFDFDAAFSYVNGNGNGSLALKEKTEQPVKLFLYNSFADNIAQYNYRTALFFENTTPLYLSDSKATSLNDLFNQGIGVSYFKPTRIINESLEKETQTIAKAQIISKDLKIYASMLTSKYDYIDNSYEITSGTGKKLATKNLNEDYEGYGPVSSEYYTFEKQQAYCAAIRNNLIFYSSPSQNEYGQYLHSPLMALESPKRFTPSTTIQTAIVTNKGITSLDDGEQVSIPYDVLTNKKSSATIMEIKDMLYRNAYEDKPPTIEFCWGRRDASNYVKEKKLTHIVIEREKGDRHKTYAPTCAGISISSGFLHSKEGIKSVYEGDHYSFPIIWYNKKGEQITISNDAKTAPNDAIYGIIDLTKAPIGSESTTSTKEIPSEIVGSNFLIRFYNSDLKQEHWTKEEFTILIDADTKPIVRRPIIQRVYFFGKDDSEKSKK